MLRALRILFGLLAASVAAALVLVLHLLQPFALIGLPADVLQPRLVAFAQLTALVATQIAMFVVPFGVILAPVAEMNRSRSAISYVLLGLLLAAAGYLLQYQSEGELRTVINTFAAQVFALQGLVGGLSYWLFAGRFAGWRRGGGPLRADPIPLARQKMPVSDATEPTLKPAPIQAKTSELMAGSAAGTAAAPTGKPASAGGPSEVPAQPHRKSAGSVPSSVRSSVK